MRSSHHIPCGMLEQVHLGTCKVDLTWRNDFKKEFTRNMLYCVYLLLRISPDEYSALDFLFGEVLNRELAWASLIMLTVTTGGDMWTFNFVPTKSLTVAEKRVLVFKTWGGCFSTMRKRNCNLRCTLGVDSYSLNFGYPISCSIQFWGSKIIFQF